MSQALDNKENMDAELKELWREGLTEEEYQLARVKMAKIKGRGPSPRLRTKLEQIPNQSVEAVNLFRIWPTLVPAALCLVVVLIVGNYVSRRPVDSSPYSKKSDGPLVISVQEKHLEFLMEDIVPLDGIFDEDIMLLEELS